MTKDEKRREKQQRFLAAYGGGLIKQGLVAGEYPPPSGTITGRFTRTTPPFREIPSSDPEKRVREPVSRDLACADLSEIELRVAARMAEGKFFD